MYYEIQENMKITFVKITKGNPKMSTASSSDSCTCSGRYKSCTKDRKKCSKKRRGAVNDEIKSFHTAGLHYLPAPTIQLNVIKGKISVR